MHQSWFLTGWYSCTIVGGTNPEERRRSRGTRKKERGEERKCNHRMFHRSKQEERGNICCSLTTGKCLTAHGMEGQ